MKKSTLLILILCLGSGIFGQCKELAVRKPNLPTAVKYNDYVIEMINQLSDDFTSIMDAQDSLSAERLIDSMACHSKFNQAKINNLKPFKNDETFKVAAKNYISHMDHIAHIEIPEFMRLIFSPRIETVDGQKRAEELVPVLDGVRTQLFDEAVKVQKEFAAKFKFKIAGQ